MTNIAEARKALEELKKNAAPATKAHYDTLSAAFEALGKRVTELERRVGYLDSMASAAAGFAAALPGADKITETDAIAMATSLAGQDQGDQTALVGWKGTPKQRAAQTKFFRAYQESGFLFNAEVQDILKKLHEDSAKVIGLKEHGEEFKSGGPEFYLKQFNEMNRVLTVEFENALPRLKATMGDYLNFHKIKR